MKKFFKFIFSFIFAAIFFGGLTFVCTANNFAMITIFNQNDEKIDELTTYAIQKVTTKGVQFNLEKNIGDEKASIEYKIFEKDMIIEYSGAFKATYFYRLEGEAQKGVLYVNDINGKVKYEVEETFPETFKELRTYALPSALDFASIAKDMKVKSNIKISFKPFYVGQSFNYSQKTETDVLEIKLGVSLTGELKSYALTATTKDVTESFSFNGIKARNDLTIKFPANLGEYIPFVVV